MAKHERTAERTRTRVKVLVTKTGTEKPVTGFTRDVSTNGVFVHTRSPFPKGTPVKVELLYPDGQLDHEGVVVRSQRAPVQLQGSLQSGMGISLNESSDPAEAAGDSRDTRVPIGSDVVVFSGSERHRLKLHDLSASGAALLAERDLPEMAFVRMHFKLSSTSEVIELEGVQIDRRQLDQNVLIAINFLDPPAEFVARIEALIGERGGNEEE